MLLVLLLLINRGSIVSQKLQPAVILTDEKGSVSAQKVYFGFLGCDNSTLEQAKRVEFMEKKISALEKVIEEFNQLPIIFLKRAIHGGLTGTTYLIASISNFRVIWDLWKANSIFWFWLILLCIWAITSSSYQVQTYHILFSRRYLKIYFSKWSVKCQCNHFGEKYRAERMPREYTYIHKTKGRITESEYKMIFLFGKSLYIAPVIYVYMISQLRDPANVSIFQGPEPEIYTAPQPPNSKVPPQTRSNMTAPANPPSNFGMLQRCIKWQKSWKMGKKMDKKSLFHWDFCV